MAAITCTANRWTNLDHFHTGFASASAATGVSGISAGSIAITSGKLCRQDAFTPKGAAIFYFFSIFSMPFMYGRRALGTVILPSAF